MKPINDRVLFVLSCQLDTDESLKQKIQNYQAIIQHYNQSCEKPPEYFLLYVGANIPVYALQTPEMVHYAINETKRGEMILEQMGKTLNIPKSKQIYSKGNPDIKAAHIAKNLQDAEVVGHSPWYLNMKKWWGNVHHIFNHHHSSKSNYKVETRR